MCTDRRLTGRIHESAYKLLVVLSIVWTLVSPTLLVLVVQLSREVKQLQQAFVQSEEAREKYRAARALEVRDLFRAQAADTAALLARVERLEKAK